MLAFAFLAAGHAFPQSLPGVDDLSPVNDAALIARLTERVADLYQSGKATPMKSLIDGLSRARTSLALAPAESRPLGPPEIYAKARQSIVVLGALYMCPSCRQWHVYTSAGFFLTASGVLATNYHVVDKSDAVAMGALTADGSFFPVREVLAANREDDVAIIALQGSGFTPLALSAGETVGSSVFVVSHPDGRLYSFSTGIVGRYFTEKNGSAAVPRMAITADYARGSSGAPVLNASGSVVGMVCTTTSIYYSTGDDGVEEDLQMVVKSCVPARSILRLVQGGSAR